MLRSKHAIISPSWSPDGKRIAYVSFEAGKPVVYVQTLATGTRLPVANFKGNNRDPAWSPNGQKLAIALSSEGISQIYTINTDGSGLKSNMRSPLIERLEERSVGKECVSMGRARWTTKNKKKKKKRNKIEK